MGALMQKTNKSKAGQKPQNKVKSVKLDDLKNQRGGCRTPVVVNEANCKFLG